jgi:hypothetical protein
MGNKIKYKKLIFYNLLKISKLRNVINNHNFLYKNVFQVLLQ